MSSKNLRRKTHIPIDQPKVKVINEYGATIAISSITILGATIVGAVTLFMVFQ